MQGQAPRTETLTETTAHALEDAEQLVIALEEIGGRVGSPTTKLASASKPEPAEGAALAALLPRLRAACARARAAANDIRERL